MSQLKHMARVLRPRKFSEVVGQKMPVQLLVKALTQELVLPVCTIFGPSGVGKTTIARLIAMWECCTDRLDTEPCGKCTNCSAILNNAHPDVFELDGGTYTGVDAVKSMLDNIDYAPIMGKKRVYILDEFHMLSRHSMSALLKKFEESLPNVQFILATTNVEKIPFTILSRSFQIELSPISFEDVRNYLMHLTKTAEYKIDSESLDYIAEASSGSMRQGISIFEQLSILCQNDITADQTREMLGISPKLIVQQIVDFLQDGNVDKLSNLITNTALNIGIIKQVLHEIAQRIKSGKTSKKLVEAGYNLAKSSVIIHKSPYSEHLVEICLLHASCA